MNELEEMKIQMAMLQTKLSKEEIINEQLLREVTRHRVKHINRNIWQEGLCVLFVCTFGNYLFHWLGCSWWFIAGTTIMMFVCFFATIIPHRKIKESDILQGDLLTVAKQVQRLRKWYKEWMKIGLPMLVVWLVWLLVELYVRHTGDLLLFVIIAVGILLGALIGGLIGSRQNDKLVSEMDEIIEQIE